MRKTDKGTGRVSSLLQIVFDAVQTFDDAIQLVFQAVVQNEQSDNQYKAVAFS
jgi:hypothetical protein